MRALLASALLLVGACSAGSAPTSPASGTVGDTAASAMAEVPVGLQLILDHPPAPTTDVIQVFVCDVPVPTTDALYGDMPLRLRLDPKIIATQMDDNVTRYFATLSHGLYRPTFIAGEVLAMTADESHDTCVERAIDASDTSASVVMVVADAEHLSTQPGGWGRPGTPCAAASCPAATTRRALYVGASDFFPGNRVVPLLDLIEHEIGHTLDMPHSGDAGDPHASALDLMSNSAAPRDVQPSRKDGQDTLAVNRLALGWLPRSALAVTDATGGTFDLSPSTGTTGLRLLVLPLDGLRFLTVEYLASSGLDDFLPAGGLAVHRIDQAASVCEPANAITGLCTGIDREQITLGSTAPHLELLAAGETWHVEGWDVTNRSVPGRGGTTVRVEVRPTER